MWTRQSFAEIIAQKKNLKNWDSKFIFHEASGIRTPDNLIKSQVLYQLSYTPLFSYNTR